MSKPREDARPVIMVMLVFMVMVMPVLVDLLIPVVALMLAATAVHGTQHERGNALRHINNNQPTAHAQKLQQNNCGIHAVP